MTNTLLHSLRERILDESEPLAGLLRKCLLLGAETHSDSLRNWARSELNGYGDMDTVPDYRRLPSPPIRVDSISGNTWTKGQTYHRLQLPIYTHEAVPEEFSIRQPIEELETLAKSSSIAFTTGGLAYAQTLWNSKLDGMFQQIVNMSFVLSGSTITGVLSQIRTYLIDVIADLTADTPLTELPGKDQVDAAVGQHIGTQYNTTIQSSTGPTAIGTKAEATANGVKVEEAIKLLDSVHRTVTRDVSNEHDRAELLDVIADLREVAEQTNPDTGEIVKKVGKLSTIADRVGVPTLGAAVAGATEAFISLAMTGAFG